MKPEAAVFTAQVYSRLKPSAHGTTYTAQVQELIAEGREVQDIAGALGNALETVTAELVPETALWKERLLARGAQGAYEQEQAHSGRAVY